MFSFFCYYLPLEKDKALHLNKLESPSPKDGLYHFLLKLAQWIWRRRRTCEKFPTTSTATTTPTTMMSTDDGQIVIREALEPSAQVSLKACYCSWLYNLLNALTAGLKTYVWPGGPDTMKGNPHGVLIEH